MDADRVAALRREYLRAGLDESTLAADPMTQFATWFADAVAAGLREPNAMVVATATPDAVPSARLVLLKGAGSDGFVFYTNYGSRKAGELAVNPHVALLFPWHDLDRQVRAEGTVRKLDAETSAAYFATRPRGAQVGAWASPQSSVIGDRAELVSRVAELTARFADDERVPRPEYWGGFRVVPDVVEFWQGRADRLHDRLRYRRAGDGWVVERLAP